MNTHPIGIFDSDIGGLSVVAEIRQRFPNENIIYFADTKNYPYGIKTKEEVYGYFENAVEFLISKKVKAILCACSTASAVAIPHYKNTHNICIQGLFNKELISEINEHSLSKELALIATELTVKSKAFEKLILEDSNLKLKSIPATDLVHAVTYGNFSDAVIMPIINKLMLNFNLNSLGALIIGCTHFYHVKNQLKTILKNIPIIEPSKVAVSCIKDHLERNNLLNEKSKTGTVNCYVSGNIDLFKPRVKDLERNTNFSFIDHFHSN